MRTLGRIVLGMIVLLLIWASAEWGIGLWQDRLQAVAGDGNNLGDRVLFEPIAGRAMRFNVANHQGWLVVRGHVRAAREIRRRSLPLTIDVRILNDDGEEIFKQRRFLALQQSDVLAGPYGLVAGDDRLPVWVLPEEWIDLSGHPAARAVSVQVIDQDPSIASIFWRASIQVRLTDEAALLRYERLRKSSRVELTAGYVTPSSLLSPEITRQLLQHRLLPVGPLGREGVDYRTQRILREPTEQRQPDYSKSFYSLVLAPAQRVSMQLEQALPVRIELQTPDPDGPGVELWRSGRGAATRVAMIGRPGMRIILPAGTYEFRTGRPLRIAVTNADTGAPVLPSGFHLRSAIVTPGRPLSYQLVAIGSKVAPVRLEMRPLTTSTHGMVRMLDVQGNTVASQPFKLNAVPSLYDRTADPAELPVSEPAVILLDIPGGVRGLRIESDAIAAVTAFTRPASARGQTRGTRTVESKRWFSFLPEQHLPNDTRGFLLVLRQPRMGRRPSAPAPAATTPRKTRPILRLRVDTDTHQESSHVP